MRAIVLAAGEGARLRPHTLDRPKCLVEIDGVSLLARQLAVLNSRGIHDIVVVGGYLASMLAEHATRLYINPRFAETNMVWTLFCAEEELRDGALIAYGDIVYSAEILERVLASPADIAVAIDLEWKSYWAARSQNPLADAESLRLGRDGRILEIGRRPKDLHEIEGQYMGLIKVSTAGFEALQSVFRGRQQPVLLGGRTRERAHMTDLLQAAIDDGVRVDSVAISGEWVEVDTTIDLDLRLTHERLESIRLGI